MVGTLRSQRRESRENSQPQIASRQSDSEHRILNIFLKEKSGGHKTFTFDLDVLILSMLSEGDSAVSITRNLEILACHYEELLNRNNEERSTPSLTYITRMRSSLETLNEIQIREFIQKAESLILATDGSPSLNARNINCVGLYNEKGNYIAASIEFTEAKTGRQLADHIKTEIAKYPNIKAKLRQGIVIMSDSC